MIIALLQAGCAVYSPHTAFDNTTDGINERLAKALELTEISPLRPRDGDGSCKVVVFVPEKDLPAVSKAMFDAGAGRIGKYSECSFRLAGVGTFHGAEDTRPTVGQKGRREEVHELRLEVVCPESAVARVAAAIRKSHSYEEPAYDIYPLRPGASSVGEGRIGKLTKAVPLKKLAQTLKRKLNAAQVQVVGDPAKEVRRVAIVCGAGGEFLHDAVRARADVFLTGEMRFHDYLAARAQDISLVLPGHYATERPAVEELATQLQQQFAELRVWASQQERDPVGWV
jgi:dinuclear metal center YbgI/SA1388 family protein